MSTALDHAPNRRRGWRLDRQQIPFLATLIVIGVSLLALDVRA